MGRGRKLASCGLAGLFDVLSLLRMKDVLNIFPRPWILGMGFFFTVKNDVYRVELLVLWGERCTQVSE